MNGITLYICKTKCWNCGEEYKAAYTKWVISERQTIASPDTFSERIEKLAKENGVIITQVGYERVEGNIDVYNVNICPHCGKPFGNGHIKELVGNEIKEIVVRK